MKISERVLELKEPVIAAIMQVARAKIEEGGPVTDEDWADYLGSPEYRHNGAALVDLSATVGAIAGALDEWQASVEERLRGIIGAAPAVARVGDLVESADPKP